MKILHENDEMEFIIHVRVKIVCPAGQQLGFFLKRSIKDRAVSSDHHVGLLFN